MLTIDDLHDYQLQVIDKIIQQKKLALWLDMGLGKTIISLTAISKLIASRQVNKACIIAPKTVCETVWEQEASNWIHTMYLRVSVAVGDATAREKALRKDADVYVVSRDNLAWLFQQAYFSADMLVIDESTSFKDRSTQRWASLCQKSINKGGKKYYRKQAMIDMFDRVLLLSGTPASESYQGLWSQIYLLDRGLRLGKTISQFRQDYMLPSYFGNSAYPVYTKMRPGAIDAINSRLQDICISMQSKDYLQLPDRINIVRHVDSSSKYYKEMERYGVISIDGTDIIAGDTLTRYNKLQQLTAGFVYDEYGKAYGINTAKEEALKELIESTDEHVLVMYHYEYERRRLEKLGGISLDNTNSIADWKAGKIKTGLLYPASGGYGLNLASGGNVVVWYTVPLSLEQYLQSNSRIHRQGQQLPVRVYHLLGIGTIDEKIYELLRNKKEVLQNLMEYFK